MFSPSDPGSRSGSAIIGCRSNDRGHSLMCLKGSGGKELWMAIAGDLLNIYLRFT
jgi:hypothetical protein